MMETDYYSLSEKILREVESVIIRDERLEEFVIIPVSLNQNKSPVVHVEHNLGLESWCVKHVYSYAYQKVLQNRRLVSKRKLLYEEYDNVNRLILGVLLINPDVSTFWNMRRELVCDNLLEISNELKISKLVLSHKSKSNEAFAYRKWLIKRLLSSGNLELSGYFLLLNQEFKICHMTAKKSANNYHAWSHRIWCMENIAKYLSDMMVVVRELIYSERWISLHVSEYTGFHYRQYVLNRVRDTKLELDEKEINYFYQYFEITEPVLQNDKHLIILNLLGDSHRNWSRDDLNILFKEFVTFWCDLKLNSELNETFQEHESIWCHRRYIVYKIFTLICEYFGVTVENTANNLDLIFTGDKREYNIVENKLITSNISGQQSGAERCAKLMKHERTVVQSSRMFQVLLNNEKNFIEKCAKLKNRQNYFAKRHEKWLYYISCLTIV